VPHPAAASPPADEPQGERRSRILDAAERCFVREGFHRTTMQDVAAEAGMSPGNLYRYFASKDAMVVGLAERDRARMGQDFAQIAEADDFLAALAQLGRKHFVEEPREKAVLCLQIWAEATRSAAFAAISADFERDVVSRMTELFRQAQQRGAVAAGVDPESAALLVSTLANGLFVRRAVVPSFDAEREVSQVLAVIEAMLSGAITLPTKSGPGGASS
jgi:TetR/AcrR family transcriptional repressor of uid operon